MLEALFKRWKQGHGVESSFPLAGIKLGWASPLSYSIVEWDHRGHKKQRSSVFCFTVNTKADLLYQIFRLPAVIFVAALSSYILDQVRPWTWMDGFKRLPNQVWQIMFFSGFAVSLLRTWFSGSALKHPVVFVETKQLHLKPSQATAN